MNIIFIIINSNSNYNNNNVYTKNGINASKNSIDVNNNDTIYVNTSNILCIQSKNLFKDLFFLCIEIYCLGKQLKNISH